MQKVLVTDLKTTLEPLTPLLQVNGEDPKKKTPPHTGGVYGWSMGSIYLLPRLDAFSGLIF